MSCLLSACRRLLLSCALLLAGAGVAGAAPTAPLPDKALQQALDDCRRDPAYRIGGAAMGDCLDAHSARADARIAERLAALAATHCPVIGQALARQQQAWVDHRHGQCGVYRQLFDNTAMAVNAAVCTLRMGLQRAHELEQLQRYQPGEPLGCEWTPATPPIP